VGLLEITPGLEIDEQEIQMEFIHASGPGGQNVNKVASAVQLRFDTASPSLPQDVAERLRKLAGKRLSADGILVLEASRYRSQAQNRQDAIDRFVELVRAATKAPKARRRTQPTAESKRRRLAEKRRRGEIKRLRRDIPTGDE
jgi:ribosome-associated protein